MILVTGGTGRIGKQLVRLLAERKAPFKVLCRKPEQARMTLPGGVRLVQGVFENTPGLQEAMEGVKVVFLLSSDNPRQAELQSHLIRAARNSGVERVVKLSILGAREDSPLRVARAHWETEQELSRSGMEWTLLRPNFFCQNFLQYASTIRNESRIYAPAGTGRASVVDVRDVARVAADVLTQPDHAGRVYDLTGPQELSYADAARLISAVVGTRVVYKSLSVEETRQRMHRTGWPTWLVDDHLERYRCWAGNHAAVVTRTLETLMGKPPMSFVQFARDHANAFSPGKLASQAGRRGR